jgi:hypothetical protein
MISITVCDMRGAGKPGYVAKLIGKQKSFLTAKRYDKHGSFESLKEAQDFMSQHTDAVLSPQPEPQPAPTDAVLSPTPTKPKRDIRSLTIAEIKALRSQKNEN